MIRNGKGCHYLAVKTLSALLRGTTLKHDGDFYCLSCFYLFRTKNELGHNKNVCKNKCFCGFLIPSEDSKILEFNQYRKFDKAPLIIYANLESLIKKLMTVKTILKNHLQQK